jgi:MFS family permease
MQNGETTNNTESDEQSLVYSWYIVFLCMIAYVFSFIDRTIVNLLVEPISADLNLTDTQFSLIQGLAFALCYATMGIPIARLADSKSRPLIISLGICFWSIATAACGVTKTFWQLFVARMGVGVGEAALSPAAYSMISDSFPKSKLGLALGVYSTGPFIGAGLAFFIGGTVIGYVSDFGIVDLPLLGIVKPWQMTFFIVGLPGVFIAALFFLTVRDPERKGIQNSNGFPIREIVAYISTHRKTFASHYFGFGFLSLSLFAMLSWAAAFLIRKFGLSIPEVGNYLTIVVMFGNSAGVLCSGLLTDYFTRRGYADAPLRSAMIGGLGGVIPAAMFSFIPDLHGALFLLGLAMFFTSFPLATSAAALQLMAPNQMRAQVTSLFFIFLNIIGITGGSTLVALCTDYVFVESTMVGYSMSLISSLAALTGAVILFWGLKHFSATADAVATGK